MHKGSCLCGEVKFEVSGKLGAGEMCHCTECRKWTGHVYASVDVPRDELTIYGEEKVSWFKYSEKVRRGFCSNCGSSMFFDPIDIKSRPWVAVALGAFDNPTEINIELHIFVAEKGDYYDIPDNQKAE